MPINMDNWDPPEPRNFDDEPKLADLVNTVVALLGPGEPVPVETTYGVRDKVELDHLVVFNSQGKIAGVFPGFGFFQASIQSQVRGRPVTVGKLKRPGKGYQLDPSKGNVKEIVRDELIAAGLISDDDGLPDQHQRRVKAEAATRVEDDDGGF